MPVCEDVTTAVSNENDFNDDECIKPFRMTKLGDMFRQGNGQVISMRVCVYVSSDKYLFVMKVHHGEGRGLKASFSSLIHIFFIILLIFACLGNR